MHSHTFKRQRILQYTYTQLTLTLLFQIVSTPSISVLQMPIPLSLSRCLCYQGLFVCSWFECETWVHYGTNQLLTLTDPFALAYLEGPSQSQA